MSRFGYQLAAEADRRLLLDKRKLVDRRRSKFVDDCLSKRVPGFLAQIEALALGAGLDESEGREILVRVDLQGGREGWQFAESFCGRSEKVLRSCEAFLDARLGVLEPR